EDRTRPLLGGAIMAAGRAYFPGGGGMLRLGESRSPRREPALSRPVSGTTYRAAAMRARNKRRGGAIRRRRYRRSRRARTSWYPRRPRNKLVKRESLAGFQPGIEGKHRDGAMVAVAVDGPLREYHVRAFRGEYASEGLIVCSVDDCAAVVLAGKSGPCIETLTGFPGFGGADDGTAPRSAAEPLTAIQVQQNHLMAELGVARDRPGAAAFRIARMTARDDYLEGLRGRVRHERQGGEGREQPAA